MTLWSKSWWYLSQYLPSRVGSWGSRGFQTPLAAQMFAGDPIYRKMKITTPKLWTAAIYGYRRSYLKLYTSPPFASCNYDTHNIDDPSKTTDFTYTLRSKSPPPLINDSQNRQGGGVYHEIDSILSFTAGMQFDHFGSIFLLCWIGFVILKM